MSKLKYSKYSPSGEVVLSFDSYEKFTNSFFGRNFQSVGSLILTGKIEEITIKHFCNFTESIKLVKEIQNG